MRAAGAPDPAARSRSKKVDLHNSFYEAVHEARRKFTELWWTGREQSTDHPSCDRATSLENIDNAAAELAMQLNFMEEFFGELMSLTESTDGGAV